MTRHQKTFELDPHSTPFSAEEQVVIYEARQILLRHLNQNPVLSSWQAVLDYCALTIRGEVERFHVLYLDKKNRPHFRRMSCDRDGGSRASLSKGSS